MITKIVPVSFDFEIIVEKRIDRWAATVKPFGLATFTVYEDSEEAVEERAVEAIKFFLKNFNKYNI